MLKRVGVCLHDKALCKTRKQKIDGLLQIANDSGFNIKAYPRSTSGLYQFMSAHIG